MYYILHSHTGDIKPKNVMRVSGAGIRLIDFDAAAQLKTGFSAAKFSSAYSPPELVFFDNVMGTHAIKSFKQHPNGKPVLEGLPYTVSYLLFFLSNNIGFDIVSLCFLPTLQSKCTSSNYNK